MKEAKRKVNEAESSFRDAEPQAINVDGVWQIDDGESQGKNDLGAPSTFVIIEATNKWVYFNVYRDIDDGVYDYDDIIYR